MFISAGLPPSWSGQAIALGRLCLGMDPETYCFCSSQTYHRPNETAASDERHPVNYHELPPETVFDDEKAPAETRRSLLRAAIEQRAWAIATRLAEDGCDLAVACTGDFLSPPAARLAAKWLGIPYLFYCFDDYVGQWTDPVEADLAAEIGADLTLDASAVIAPNEFVARAITGRHGVEPVIIRNACRPEAVVWCHAHNARVPTSNPDQPKVLYSGAVYHVNGETLDLVGRALDRVADSRGRLVLRTAQPDEAVRRAGVTATCVQRLDHVPPVQIEREQREADVLLLAFNFGGPLAGVIRTSAPMKLGDYLASGQPILAVVPPDTFLAHHLTEHDAAVVVTEPEVSAVAAALDRLFHDRELCRRIVDNARRLAISEYAPGTNRRTLLDTMRRAIDQPGGPEGAPPTRDAR